MWHTPASIDYAHMSKVLKSGSPDPSMDNVSCEISVPDDSTGGLVVTLTTGVIDCKSEPEPLEGNKTTPGYCKTEDCSENQDNTTLTHSNIVIQKVEFSRQTALKFNEDEDSKKVNKAEKYSVSLQVDAPLIPFIKGKWGLTQKLIEGETCVKIIFPSSEGESYVVIEGASMENVNRASEKITNVLEQAVNSRNLDYSHFVSLPLAIHPELVEKLHNFQKSVLEEVNMIPAMGIDRFIFNKPETFHLTVLMLKLWNKDRIAMATNILKGISSKVMEALENRPVSIRLRGLLHATLMNTGYRSRLTQPTRRTSFDARGIFKRYGSEDWGEYAISEAHLSQRYVFDESGYYHCCGLTPFPESIKID